MWKFSQPDITDEGANEESAADMETDKTDNHMGADPTLNHWTGRELKDMHTIHVALTIKLCDKDKVAESRVQSASALWAYLVKHLHHPLAFILNDIEVAVIPSGKHGGVVKVDIVSALVQWVGWPHALK